MVRRLLTTLKISDKIDGVGCCDCRQCERKRGRPKEQAIERDRQVITKLHRSVGQIFKLCVDCGNLWAEREIAQWIGECGSEEGKGRRYTKIFHICANDT